jgi:YidC/Oxa1 family membrane protein insertase
MERRVLIAILLSVAVLYGYQALFPAPPAKPREQAASTSSAPTGGAPSGVAASNVPAPSPAPTTAAANAPAAVVTESAERDVVIENALVRAVFTNRGGRLKSWQLKKHQDVAGRQVDLVPQELPPGHPLPFSLRVDENDLTPRLNTALFRATTEGGGAERPSTLAFDYEDASGLKARKEFRIEPESYIVTFSASVHHGAKEFVPYVQWGPGLGDSGASAGGGSFFTGNLVQPPGAISYDGDSVTRAPATSVAEGKVHEGALRFAGVDDHYFIAAAINPGQTRVEYRALSVPVPGDADARREYVMQTFRFPKAPQAAKFYIGPKSFDEMKATDAEFVRAINFGMFSFLCIPFLSALKWIHAVVGNWGWTIIIFTIFINIVMFPLRHKSMVSMKKMQAIQPQLKAIQDRYKDLKVSDPSRQKMNTEVMNLYREKGVNPASGCVPMLLTFPVLLAFYSMLSQAIELRGAPFGLWIHDLSLPDPYYIFPVLMGAAMFWQTKMTPTSVDPMQQRMMLIMPVMFVALFLRSPSGLAIYYLMSTLLTIGQQYVTTRLIGAPVPAAPRPAAERRLKNAGSGRTEGAERKS